MCGRYELHSHPTVIALQFGLARPPELAARYNIAPQQQVPVVRQDAAGERELVSMRWGLVPFWAKDADIGARTINARSETVAEKPAFRNAFRRHRCLLPADGFYEWAKQRVRKQPVRVHRADGRLLGLAGLWERWRGPDGVELETCTILTTGANALVAPVHDRMPVIVDPADYECWLRGSADEAAALLRPAPAGELALHPVSLAVNNVRNDAPALIEPLPG
jgi:putative SOS response-associated peptidase YedK